MSGCKDNLDTCDDINAWNCYNNTVRYECCQACGDYSTQPVIPGCEYGDHIGQCDVDNGRRCYYTDIQRDCCSTCHSYETSVPGCKYGDRIGQCDVDNGRRCYITDVQRDCCSTCLSYETSVPGCRYGDKVSNCIEADCNIYSPQRLADCCGTCSNDTHMSTGQWSSTSSSTDNSVTNGMSQSSGVPGWTVPLAAGIGGVIVLVIVVVVIILYRRHKKSDNLSPIDDQMYKEYKLSKRPPIAPPRHPSTEKDWVDESKGAEYAYINPDNVQGPTSDVRRTGNDPLPLTPAEYLDLTDAHTVAGEYDYSRYNDGLPDVQNHDRARSNKYDEFPGSTAYGNQSENGDVSHKL